MAFNIMKVHYPRTLMFGEEYDFSKITVETDLPEDITIDKIDATWLETQPPFGTMGYYPLQIVVTASNGEEAIATVTVFVFEKPHDGYRKFFIYTYKNVTYLLSYDCPDNPEYNSLYHYNQIKLEETTSYNGYIGQQGYTFDEESKSWVFEKDYSGYPDYTIRSKNYVSEILYSNSDIYAERGKINLIHKADELKNLPQWDKDIEQLYVGEYTNLREFDDTFDAYFIMAGSHESKTNLAMYAYCFRNLSKEGALSLKLTPVGYNPLTIKLTDKNVEYAIMYYQKGVWRYRQTWTKAINHNSTINMPSYAKDDTFGYLTLMNSLQELDNVDFEICDINGEYGRSFLNPRSVEQEVVKSARYRIKDEETGEYQVVHFQTGYNSVVGLPEKMVEVETSLQNQYTKNETNTMMALLEGEVSSLEEVANGLSQRLTQTETDITTLQTNLTQEINRATSVENDLKQQIDLIDQAVEIINHKETGILVQANTYTDEKVAEINEVIKDLETGLNGNQADLQTKLDELTTTVENNKVAIETKTNELDTRITTIENRSTLLENNIVELETEDTRLATEIQSLKNVLSNKGNDTLIFATREEFENATLTPKTGDLVHVLDEKKSYIWNGTAWILFDSITSEEDIKDYAKKTEVSELLTETETKLTAETNRALAVEKQLETDLNELSGVVDGNKQNISSLDNLTQNHQSEIDELEDRYTQEQIDFLVNEAIELQRPHLSDEEPTLKGLKCGHVWLDTTIE